MGRFSFEVSEGEKMKIENWVWVIFGTLFFMAWIYSNIVTWGTKSLIPFLVIFGGWIGGVTIAFWQFHQATKDLF